VLKKCIEWNFWCHCPYWHPRTACPRCLTAETVEGSTCLHTHLRLFGIANGTLLYCVKRSHNRASRHQSITAGIPPISVLLLSKTWTRRHSAATNKAKRTHCYTNIRTVEAIPAQGPSFLCRKALPVLCIWCLAQQEVKSTSTSISSQRWVLSVLGCGQCICARRCLSPATADHLHHHHAVSSANTSPCSTTAAPVQRLPQPVGTQAAQ
jgi:hypothetical protein